MDWKVTPVAASICPRGVKLLTVELVYPRIIHSELMTHRSKSRSAGSSRAIPTPTMLKRVRESPAMPVEWGKNQAGMQSAGEHAALIKIPDHLKEAFAFYSGVNFDTGLVDADTWWRFGAQLSADISEGFSEAGYHKQVANRPTEPYQWMTTLVSATEWDNFFELRCHPDADPTFQKLAYMIKEAHDTVTYQPLKTGQWHLPYILAEERTMPLKQQIILSTARCARVSIAPFDGNPQYEKEQSRYELLVGSVPRHSSPTEHQATPWSGWNANFFGWRQQRQFIEAGGLPF